MKANLSLVMLLLLSLNISACHTMPSESVVAKGWSVSTEPPPPHIRASFSVGNTPEVEKAYSLFTKTGMAKTVSGAGFKTFAFETYSRPIVSCAPLRLCVIQLEQGETINNIDLGDSEHWLVSTAIVGTVAQGSYQITLKPKAADLATDLVITTNLRTYNIGLVSKLGGISEVVSFYYPSESLKAMNEQLPNSVGVEAGKSVTPLLQFNYSIEGKNFPWRPIRAFDDGTKTFIELPSGASRGDLPVVYVKRGSDLQLVNYRYQSPDYVVDGVFKTLVLVSGTGKQSETVAIHNLNVNL